MDPFLDSHEIYLQELYGSQVWIKLFLYWLSLAIWDCIDFLKGKQYKQAKQYIWEWFRVVVSEVPGSCKQFIFPAN